MKTFNNKKTAKLNKGGGIIVAKDFDETETGKKKYEIFSSFEEFYNKLVDNKEKGLPSYYNEFLEAGKPSNFPADLDITSEEDPEGFKNPEERVKTVINTFWDNISDFAGFEVLPFKTVVLVSPPTENKKSYHIIFRMKNAYFADSTVCKKFAEKYLKSFVDTQIYRNDGLLRTIYSCKITKEGNNFELDEDLTDGTESILSLDAFASYCPFNSDTVLIEKSVKKQKVKDADFPLQGEIDIEDIQKLLNGLSPERYIDRNKWLNVGFILKDMNSLYKDLFHEFSKKWEKYKAKDCEDAWKSLTKGNHGIRELIHLYNIDNPTSPWKKHMQELTRDYECRDDIISRFIYKYYSTDFVCTNIEKNVFYSFNGNTWELEDGNFELRLKIINEIVPIFENRRKHWRKIKSEAKDTRDKELANIFMEANNKIVSRLGNGNRLVCLELFFKDKEFMKHMNSKNELLAFENGVLELETLNFRKGKHDDYITMFIDYSYEPEVYTDYNEIENLLKDIFPEEELFRYMMVVFASFLYGGNREEVFYIFTGSGSNGKSLCEDLFHYALKSYFITGRTSLLTAKREDSNTANSSLMNLKDKRVAFFQEAEATDFLNVGLIKQMTGGDQISSRDLYNSEGTFNVSFVPVLSANDCPKVKTIDGGFLRRLKMIEFKSKFVDNPDPKKSYQKKIDRTIKDRKRMEALAKTFLHYLIKFWMPIYIQEGITNIPKSVEAFTTEYLNDNDVIKDFVDENIDEEEGSFLLLSDLKDLHKFNTEVKQRYTVKVFQKKIEDKLGNKFIKSKVRGEYRDKIVLEGYKLKSQE